MPPRSLFVDAERRIRALYQFDTGRCSGSFDATKPEFVPIDNEIAALPDLEPAARLTQDRVFRTRGRQKNWATHQCGPSLGRKRLEDVR